MVSKGTAALSLEEAFCVVTASLFPLLLVAVTAARWLGQFCVCVRGGGRGARHDYIWKGCALRAVVGRLGSARPPPTHLRELAEAEEGVALDEGDGRIALERRDAGHEALVPCACE